MANTKSAIKRIRTNERRRVRNRTIRSHVRSAKLFDLRALRASVLRRVGVEIPPSADSAASFTFGGQTRTGLGLLSDSGTWPLAYHAFSTARKKSALARRLAAAR